MEEGYFWLQYRCISLLNGGISAWKGRHHKADLGVIHTVAVHDQLHSRDQLSWSSGHPRHASIPGAVLALCTAPAFPTLQSHKRTEYGKVMGMEYEQGQVKL